MLVSESISSGTGPFFRSQPCADVIDEANMNRGLIAFFDAIARSMRYRVPRMFGSNVDREWLKSIRQALWITSVIDSRICYEGSPKARQKVEKATGWKFYLFV